MRDTPANAGIQESVSVRPSRLMAIVILSFSMHTDAQVAADFNGRLYRAVSNFETDSPFTNEDRVRVPPPLRSRFDAFVRCRATFRSGLPRPKTFFESAARNHQKALERALACLFEAPGVALEATQYTRRARILYEWEGMPESPIEEAQYAENYIVKNPGSRFVPYLYLFVAERWRCAFEYFARDGDTSGMVTSARKYRDFIARARNADPLVELVADDADNMPFLVVNVSKHPRTQ